MIEVRRAVVEEWPLVKETRLRALAEAPYAFGSTLARELGFTDEVWRQRVGEGDWFLARAEGRVVGLAAAVTEEAHPRERQLVAVWVDPAHRGSATATSLVEAVCARARARGAAAVSSWVADGNSRARRLHERIGFRSSGERRPLPSNPDVGEERLLLPLDTAQRR